MHWSALIAAMSWAAMWLADQPFVFTSSRAVCRIKRQAQCIDICMIPHLCTMIMVFLTSCLYLPLMLPFVVEASAADKTNQKSGTGHIVNTLYKNKPIIQCCDYIWMPVTKQTEGVCSIKINISHNYCSLQLDFFFSPISRIKSNMTAGARVLYNPVCAGHGPFPSHFLGCRWVNI